MIRGQLLSLTHQQPATAAAQAPPDVRVGSASLAYVRRRSRVKTLATPDAGLVPDALRSIACVLVRHRARRAEGRIAGSTTASEPGKNVPSCPSSHRTTYGG